MRSNSAQYVRPLLNAYVPTFRRRIERETEKHYETNRSQLELYFELTWIEINQGRVEVHLTIAFINTVGPFIKSS